MNNTNSTSATHGLNFTPMLITFMTLQQFVFVVACTGNAIVIFIFVKYIKLKSNTNKFVVVLAVSDFLTGISSGTQIFYFFYPSISFHQTACFFRYHIVGYSANVSQITVMLTTLDRYIAICHPHKYNKIMTDRVAIALCTLPWVSFFVLYMGTFLGWHQWTPESPCIYTKIFTSEFYFVKSIIMYGCGTAAFMMYVFILRTAWHYHRRVKPMGEINNQQATKSKDMEKDMRGAKVMGIITILFTISWLPAMGFPFRKGITLDDLSMSSLEVFNWLVFLGIFKSCINPFIYSWKRRDFRNHFKKLLCCSKNTPQAGRTQTSTLDC